MQFVYLIIFSQNHRMGQVGSDHSGSSGPVSLIKQGHLRAHGTGLCPDGSGLSPVEETPHPLWATCSSVQSLHSKEVLPHIQVELPGHQFLPIASCPIAWHHRLEPSSIFVHLPADTDRH